MDPGYKYKNFTYGSAKLNLKYEGDVVMALPIVAEIMYQLGFTYSHSPHSTTTYGGSGGIADLYSSHYNLYSKCWKTQYSVL
jgi:hypothetical protein